MILKTALLTRNIKISGPDGTYGKMSASGFDSVSMERPPVGVVIHPLIPLPLINPYLVELALSPAFYAQGLDLGYGRGMIYHVRGVPGRDYILIHPANWPVMIIKANDPQHYQLEGCIALGAAVAMLQVPTPDGRTLKGITSSVEACKAFYAAMGGQPFNLEIKEEA
jgi:hypothetical protein